MTLKPLLLFTLVLFSFHLKNPHDPKAKVKNPSPINLQVQTFPLGTVRLLESPFKKAKEKDLKYLLELEPDRLLHWHRKAAGLKPKGEHYGGWENGGSNIMGHYLTACALMYATTKDKRLLDKVNYMVDELELCQQNRKDGALFNHPGFEENFRKMANDTLEFKVIGPEFPLVNDGNPWYGLHKVYAGLRDAFVYTGNEKAKQVLIKFTDWAVNFSQMLSEEQFQKMLDVEHGGMTEVIADVYGFTGNKKHLELAKKFVHRSVMVPMLEGRDMLYPHHANNQIPKFVGYSRLYELTGDDGQAEGKSAERFWDLVIKNHTVVIGGNSEYERFGPAGEVSQRIGFSSSETCNTYNMLKLSNHLYRQSGNVKYINYFERAFYNHIFASLDPEEGMFCYYVSLKPGHFKTFSTKFNSNWCCVGSGMENPGKYEESIYAHDDKNVMVNLFIPSELNWKEKNFTIQQETAYPESDRIKLKIANPGKENVGIKIRLPEWVKGEPELLVNGKKAQSKKENGYISLNHKWQKGDEVVAVFPMHLHFESTPDNPNVSALLYGPIVLAGELGKSEMEKVTQYQEDMWTNVNAPVLEQIPYFVNDKNKPEHWIKPVDGSPLTFTALPEGSSEAITFKPFYKTHHERYSVYWDIFSPDEWKRYNQKKGEWVIDEILMKDSLQELAHQLKSEKSWKGKRYSHIFRSAKENGWFSYELKCDKEASQFLMCQFWGGGWGTDPKGKIDLFVEDVKIGTYDFTDKSHETLFFYNNYSIPERLTRGKEKITVRFQPKQGEINTGVFKCKVVKGEGLTVKDMLGNGQ